MGLFFQVARSTSKRVREPVSNGNCPIRVYILLYSSLSILFLFLIKFQQKNCELFKDQIFTTLLNVHKSAFELFQPVIFLVTRINFASLQRERERRRDILNLQSEARR